METNKQIETRKEPDLKPDIQRLQKQVKKLDKMFLIEVPNINVQVDPLRPNITRAKIVNKVENRWENMIRDVKELQFFVLKNKKPSVPIHKQYEVYSDLLRFT